MLMIFVSFWQRKPVEVNAICIDKGCVVATLVKDIFALPDHLKAIPPQAIEVFLVGVKPIGNNSSWSRTSTDFIRSKLMGKEMDGRIVLALSSTLFLDPLVERACLQGSKSKQLVYLFDPRREILNGQFGETNEEHLGKLYHLCQAGGIELADYSVGLAKKSDEACAMNHAFLPLKEETQVEVAVVVSPLRFYVTIFKFQRNLQDLETDIKAGVNCRCCFVLFPFDSNPFNSISLDSILLNYSNPF